MLSDPQPYFAQLVDPRRATRNKLHKLVDIVMITLVSGLSSCEDWVSIEDFVIFPRFDGLIRRTALNL